MRERTRDGGIHTGGPASDKPSGDVGSALSAELYAAVFQQVMEAILIFDPETERILEANPRACELYGFYRDEFIGLDFRMLTKDVEAGTRAIQELLEKKAISGFETVQYRRDGTPIVVRANASLIRFKGAPAVLSINADITEERARRDELRRSEEQYRLLFDDNPQPMWIFDRDTLRFLAVNEAAVRHYGYSREQFSKMTLCDIRPDSDVPKFLDVVKEAVGRVHKAGVWRHRTADGSIIDVEVVCSTLLFHGRAAELVTLRDVSEQIRMRAALEQSEAHFRALVEDTRDLITVLDADGLIRYQSPALKRMYGFEPEQLIGKSVFEFIHPEDLPRVLAAIAVGRERGTTETVRYRSLDSTGNWRVLESVGHVLSIGSVAGQIIVNSRDVTERELEQAALRESEQRLRLAQRAGGIGTFAVDVETGRGSSSGENALLYGYEEPKSIDWETWKASVHPEDRDRAVLNIQSAIATGAPHYDEFRVIWPNGEVRWLSARGQVVTDETIGARRFMGINADITHRKRIEEELERARDAALEASKAKTQFLTSISHEIRTPMNGIIGLTGLLLDSELTPEQRNDLETVRESALHLLDLINDLLDLSRLEAGKMTLTTAPFKLHDCLAAVIDLVSPQAAAKRLELSFSYAPGMPCHFIGNEGRIRQIVLNFVANAVKFTERGSVSLRAGLSSHNARGSHVRIEVRDTGPGISKELRSRLFQKFVQANSSANREHGGTGLGLAISKSLAELMGGSVGVDSEPGRGSTFWVELPLPSAAEPPDRAARVRAGAIAATGDVIGGRILVAEDNPVNQKLVTRLLTRAGARVDVAGNGKDAVQMWARLPYDLILMDCQMPLVDGYEATRTIRSAEEPGERVPILAVTAHAGQDERRRCLDAGMDDYISKPYTAADLIHRVAHWLEARAGAGAEQPLIALHSALCAPVAVDAGQRI